VVGFQKLVDAGNRIWGHGSQGGTTCAVLFRLAAGQNCKAASAVISEGLIGQSLYDWFGWAYANVVEPVSNGLIDRGRSPLKTGGDDGERGIHGRRGRPAVERPYVFSDTHARGRAPSEPRAGASGPVTCVSTNAENLPPSAPRLRLGF